MGRVNVGGGAKVNALIKEYEIAAGETINAGDLVNFINGQASIRTVGVIQSTPLLFDSAQVHQLSATTIDSSRVLVAYRQSTSKQTGIAVVLKIIDGEIIFGAYTVFKSGSLEDISATAIDSTRVVVAYRDSANLEVGTAVVLTIDDGDITVGTSVIFETAHASYVIATTLDANKVLVAYRVNGTIGFVKAIILTLNGDIITKGTPVAVNNSNIGQLSATKIDFSTVLVAYSDSDNSLYGTAVVLKINDSDIAVGTEKVINNSNTDQISATTIDLTRVLVAYRDVENSNRGTAVILTINGDRIETGTPSVFNNTRVYYIDSVTLDENRVLLTYQNTVYSQAGTAVVLTVKGNVITTELPMFFNDNNTTQISSTTLVSDRVVVVYRDAGTNYAGSTTLLKVKRTAEGLATQNGAAGETKKFYDWR